MKLSEAIRLGSLLIEEPKACHWDRCAFGMASIACGSTFKGSESDIAKAIASDVYARWPWLVQYSHDCPKCTKSMVGGECVWHPFDAHVCFARDMTIEQLADFVASIEPAEEPVSPPQTTETVEEINA